MFARNRSLRILLPAILTSMGALIALAFPGFAADPGKARSTGGNDLNGPQQRADAPNAYTLMGDTDNFGTTATTFYNFYGNASQAAWFFDSYSSNASSIAMRVAQTTAQDSVALWAESANGRGIYAQHSGTSGTGPADAAIYGETSSTETSAVAVEGVILSTSPGSSSAAVRGLNNSTGGNSLGIWGSQNGSGWGVYGSVGSGGRGVMGYGPGPGVGVYGLSVSGDGAYGETSGGAGSAGVYGVSTGTNSNGVVGIADTGTSAFGVWGRSASAVGVLGTSTANTNGRGVYGSTSCATCIGVFGQEDLGTGVYGRSSVGTGVYGESDTGVALFGSNTGSGSGFYGFSAGGPGGVMGSQVTEGARFYTRNASSYALVTGGLANTYGHAYITGNLEVTGTCCSSVQQGDGTARRMYAVESTQNVYSDQGAGQLVNGHAVIRIDPTFARAANLAQDYLVFLTPRSADTLGLAVVNQTATSFEVAELGKGKGNFGFNWRLDALRKGHESDRMELAAPAPATGGKVYEVPSVSAPPADGLEKLSSPPSPPAASPLDGTLK